MDLVTTITRGLLVAVVTGGLGCLDWDRFERLAVQDAGQSMDSGGLTDASADALSDHETSADGFAQPGILIAERCVANDDQLAVSWEHAAECSPIGFDAELLDEGCLLVAPPTGEVLGLRCDESTIEQPVYVDIPGSYTNADSIPFVDVQVDGNLDEWDQFRLVRALAHAPGAAVSESDLRGRFHFGWNERGLALVAIVEDDQVQVTPQVQARFFVNDGIEVLIDGGGDGSPCDPGCSLDPDAGEWQIFIVADGSVGAGGRPLSDDDGIELFVETGERSYAIEALFPWSLLAIDHVEPGQRLGLNLAINDRDDDERVDEDPPALLWRYNESHPFDANDFIPVALRCWNETPSECVSP